VNIGFEGGVSLELWVLNYSIIVYGISFYLSSPYLCVFDNDHVTRYMRANVDTS